VYQLNWSFAFFICLHLRLNAKGVLYQLNWGRLQQSEHLSKIADMAEKLDIAGNILERLSHSNSGARASFTGILDLNVLSLLLRIS